MFCCSLSLILSHSLSLSLSLIAWIPSIDLLADERTEKYHGDVEYSDEQRPQGQWSRRTEEEKQWIWDAASEGLLP